MLGIQIYIFIVLAKCYNLNLTRLLTIVAVSVYLSCSYKAISLWLDLNSTGFMFLVWCPKVENLLWSRTEQPGDSMWDSWICKYDGIFVTVASLLSKQSKADDMQALIYYIELICFSVVNENKVTLIKTYFEVRNWNKIMFHCASVNIRPQETFSHILPGCDYPSI